MRHLRWRKACVKGWKGTNMSKLVTLVILAVLSAPAYPEMPTCEVHCPPARTHPTRCRSASSEGNCLDECIYFTSISPDEWIIAERTCTPDQACLAGIRMTNNGPAKWRTCKFVP